MNRLLQHAPLLLLALTWAVLGILQPAFLSGDSLLNLLRQSASSVIAATGMTVVLIIGGVDLSLGAAMFLAAALAGKMAAAGQALPACIVVMLGAGAAFGALNATAITLLRVPAFVVTLAMLFLGRGLALEITKTRALNLPESFLDLGRPAAAITLAVIVVILVQIMLSKTVAGRHLYALGQNADAVKHSSISATRLTFIAFIVCGLCAGLAALLTLGQLGTVSPKFGETREFTAIAAAALGGSSLFGGRGSVFPGTVAGALLMQSIESGLVMLNANPYAYPMWISAVLLAAVLLDSLRTRRSP